MLTETIKYPKRQDCFYKLTQSNSNETSINLSHEILDVLCPNLCLGTTVPINFCLYKEDFIKALCFITLQLPLFSSQRNNFPRLEYSYQWFEKELKSINDFFVDDIMEYPVTLYYREDGRIYLKDLSYHHFNIRKFLVEDKTSMHFIKGTCLTLRLRYANDSEHLLTSVLQEKLAVQDEDLSTFIYKTFLLLAKVDGLSAISSYLRFSENGLVSMECQDLFSLPNLFLSTTIRDVASRNDYGRDIHWHNHRFILNNTPLYLNSKLAIDHSFSWSDFCAFVDACYGDKFYCVQESINSYKLIEYSI